MTKRLIAEDRYVFVLLKKADDQISERDARPAWDLVHQSDGADPGRECPGRPL